MRKGSEISIFHQTFLQQQQSLMSLVGQNKKMFYWHMVMSLLKSYAVIKKFSWKKNNREVVTVLNVWDSLKFILMPTRFLQRKLKAHWQISKKKVFQIVLNDKACQFSALECTPWRSY